LSPRHAELYAEQYKINREGRTAIDALAQKLERWMHRKVAATQGGALLELGAGTLNHVRFEQNFDNYDVVEPFQALYNEKAELNKIRTCYGTVQDIPHEILYSRIFSIAVLEHLTNLPADIAKSALHLDHDGLFQCGIPSEGGFLWWLGWRLSTGIGYYLRTGLDYGIVMRHEHVNNAQEIIAIVRHFFEDVTISRFPTPCSHLSLYSYLEARGPYHARAQAFLDRFDGAPS
jgi:hypothetical protein